LDGRSGASKRSKTLAGKAAAATGGLNFARSIFRKVLSTKSCRHQARQRSIDARRQQLVADYAADEVVWTKFF
jgi:hypothetical protein